MVIVISIAGGAVLGVVGDIRLRQHSPETGAAGLRAVRELAPIVLVGAKAVEGIVEVLSGAQRLQSSPASASLGSANATNPITTMTGTSHDLDQHWSSQGHPSAVRRALGEHLFPPWITFAGAARVAQIRQLHRRPRPGKGTIALLPTL